MTTVKGAHGARQGMKIKGFKFSGISAGIKGDGKKDLALTYSDEPFTVAGVFTNSSIKSPSVLLDRERIKRGAARAVVINSGNANACTGEAGLQDARETAGVVAGQLGIDEEEVLISSTGVIGVRLPMKKITAAAPGLVAAMSDGAIGEAAEAIRTTDSFPKACSLSKLIGGVDVTVSGIAKGAGMIAPNMATMLAYVMTDAALDRETLDLFLKKAVNASFNRITVDGDMSTNDTVLALASGASGAVIKSGTHDGDIFYSMMKEVMEKLAKMIVKDGEGATKLIEITVKGAASNSDANKAALKIAGSPLVKTAFYGEDANWGRIAAALGGAGVRMDADRFDIYFGDLKLVKDGIYAGGNAEEMAMSLMKKDELLLTVDLKTGAGRATVWTCDLTHDYIRINADYRS